MVEPTPNTKKVYISWEEIEELIYKIKVPASIKYVYGPARGGLVPAVIISHKFKLEFTDKIKDDTLIIDEICDTGSTYQKIKDSNKSKNIYLVALYKRYTSKFEPDQVIKIVDADDWLVFPWEK